MNCHALILLSLILFVGCANPRPPASEPIVRLDSPSVLAKPPAWDSLKEVAPHDLDSGKIFGKTIEEAVALWTEAKKASLNNVIDIKVLFDQYRYDNQIALLYAEAGLDTITQYYVLQLRYNTKDAVQEVELEEQLFGTVYDDINQLQTPGDGMLYLLHHGTTKESGKLLAPDVGFSDLGLLDFTGTYCIIDLKENRFDHSGQGSVGFWGGGWGDRYTWKKVNERVQLVYVNRWSH